MNFVVVVVGSPLSKADDQSTPALITADLVVLLLAQLRGSEADAGSRGSSSKVAC